MSSEALPISPTRFAAALTDLPLSALHLKVLELRNSITHLDYSNEQLRPFAEGTATTTATTTTTTPPSTQPSTTQTPTGQPQPTTTTTTTAAPEARSEPDPDCVDAIRENEAVIARMQARIALVRAEVERRGLGWAEFQSVEEREAERQLQERKVEGLGLVNGDGGGVNGGVDVGVNGGGGGGAGGVVNGTGTAAADGERGNPWRDGTFQTGVIRGGVVQMDEGGSAAGRAQGQGGSLTDEELLRRVEAQMRGLAADDEDDGEGGLHL